MINESILPTEADVQFYKDNGYWISRKLIDVDQLERLVEHMDMVYDGICETGREPVRDWKKGISDPKAIRKVDNAWWADYTIRELALNETIGAIGAILAETPTIRLWHDQLLYKPGGGEQKGNVGWHQDYGYWQCTDPSDMLTAWVAWVDVDENNGCMQFIPGSHKWGLYREGMNFFNQDLDSQFRSIKDPHGNAVEPVSVRLKAGQVSFHHCLLLHGSGPNTTSEPRRSLVIHLLPGHIRYKAGTAGDVHMNVALLGGKDGDLWSGESFPVIYTRDPTLKSATGAVKAGAE